MNASSDDLGAFAYRRRALLLLAVGGILGVVAVARQSPVPLLAALPLLLAPAVAALQAPTSVAPLALTWTVRGEGDEVRVEGHVQLPDGLAAAAVDLRFYRPEPLEETGAAEVKRAGRSLAFTLRWRAPYPCLAVVPLPEASWGDALGLGHRRLAVGGRALRIERFPPETSRLSAVRYRRTTTLPGEVRSRAIGASGEFYTLRQAVGGDAVRRINWIASARAGRLLANDYSVERTGDLLLVLDLRPTSLGPARDAELLAVAAAGALGIASGFLAEKARVGLATFDEFLTAVPLGSGRRQRTRIARALAQAKVGPVAGPAERLAVSLRRYFPPGVLTVFLTSLADDDGGLVLSHLRRRGFPVAVLSHSPLPLLERGASASADDAELAHRLYGLVRRQRLAATWREAPVIDWSDYWSLAGFVRFLATPALERRRS